MIVPDMKMLLRMAEEAGFTHAAPLDPATIELKEEVRAMCADNSCGQYEKRWSCPPGCGTLEACGERIAGYRAGILVQTVGELEDSMDVEAMMEAEAAHKASFQKLYADLRGIFSDMLALGAGCCTQCGACSYPDAPCRFPEKMVSSMEAYGMLVLDVCRRNDLKYYYGPGTIAYTSCFLLPLPSEFHT